MTGATHEHPSPQIRPGRPTQMAGLLSRRRPGAFCSRDGRRHFPLLGRHEITTENLARQGLVTTKHYGAPWGLQIGLTTGLVVGLGALGAIALPLVMKGDDSPLIVRLLPSIVIMAIFAGTGLFVVRGFELGDNRLFIRRSFWRTPVDLTRLQSATADPEACKGALKTLGNGGLFAMSGWFWSRKLGKFRAFVTAPVNSVILKLDDRTIVISPENPRSFVAEMNRRLGRKKEKF